MAAQVPLCSPVINVPLQNMWWTFCCVTKDRSPSSCDLLSSVAGSWFMLTHSLPVSFKLCSLFFFSCFAVNKRYNVSSRTHSPHSSCYRETKMSYTVSCSQDSYNSASHPGDTSCSLSQTVVVFQCCGGSGVPRVWCTDPGETRHLPFLGRQLPSVCLGSRAS